MVDGTDPTFCGPSKKVMRLGQIGRVIGLRGRSADGHGCKRLLCTRTGTDELRRRLILFVVNEFLLHGRVATRCDTIAAEVRSGLRLQCDRTSGLRSDDRSFVGRVQHGRLWHRRHLPAAARRRRRHARDRQRASGGQLGQRGSASCSLCRTGATGPSTRSSRASTILSGPFTLRATEPSRPRTDVPLPM